MFFLEYRLLTRTPARIQRTTQLNRVAALSSSDARTSRDGALVPISGHVLSTRRDHANDGADPNLRFLPMLDDEYEPNSDYSSSTNRRNAIRDAHRSHPNHGDIRRREPKPAFRKEIPLSPYLTKKNAFSRVYLLG